MDFKNANELLDLCKKHDNCQFDIFYCFKIVFL